MKASHCALVIGLQRPAAPPNTKGVAESSFAINSLADGRSCASSKIDQAAAGAHHVTLLFTRRELLAATAAAAQCACFPRRCARARPTARRTAPSPSASPQEKHAELRRRIHTTQWPERETVSSIRRKALGLAPDAGTHAPSASGPTGASVKARLERPATIHDRNRRGLDIHFIHVRSKHEKTMPLSSTTDGRLGLRTAEDHRSACQSYGPAGTAAMLSRGDSVDARLRFLRQADEPGSGPERMGGLGYADATAPTPLRGPGGDWVVVRRRPDGLAGARGLLAIHTNCPPPFEPTSTRRCWPATATLRVSAEETRAYRAARHRTFKQVDYAGAWRAAPNPLRHRLHPSAWLPGASTTMTPTASQRRRSPARTGPRAPRVSLRVTRGSTTSRSIG